MRWILAFHIISVICWFAGLFYLPRLFVYHAEAQDPISRDRFKIMERRLYRGIMLPASVLTIIFGLWLLKSNFSYYLHTGWMQIKLLFVIALIIYQAFCGYYIKQFKLEKNAHSSLFFRLFNEIPTVILVAVVILVVVQP